jgi:hypothetical protein
LRGRESKLCARLEESPDHARQSVELELVTLDFVEVQIEEVRKALGGADASKGGGRFAEDVTVCRRF